jgi:hypothetical protein
MSDVAEAPAESPEQNLTQEYVERTISSAVPDSDRKYLGEEEPEKVIPEKTQKTKTAKKPEIGDSEIPLDDEPEKAVEEGEEEDEDERAPEARTESDKAKSDAKWKQYREAYRENPQLKSELQTLRKQVAQLSDQSEVNNLRQHVQALARERERLVALVEQGAIEQSDTWNQQIMAPLNAMWEDVQTIAQRNGMDPNHLAKLLQNKDDEALSNYMDEHNARPGDRHYLFGMIRDIDRIEKHKAYLRHNAHELSQRSQQEMTARRNHYFQSLGLRRSQAVESIVPKVTEKILAVLPKDKRRNLQNDVKYILDFDKWEPDIQMFAGVSAVVLPDLLDSYNLLRGQLREAKAELIKFRGGSPKITTGGRTPATREPEEETAPESLAKTSLTDFAEESTKRIRQAMGYRK